MEKIEIFYKEIVETNIELGDIFEKENRYYMLVSTAIDYVEEPLAIFYAFEEKPTKKKYNRGIRRKKELHTEFMPLSGLFSRRTLKKVGHIDLKGKNKNKLFEDYEHQKSFAILVKGLDVGVIIKLNDNKYHVVTNTKPLTVYCTKSDETTDYIQEIIGKGNHLFRYMDFRTIDTYWNNNGKIVGTVDKIELQRCLTKLKLMGYLT